MTDQDGKDVTDILQSLIDFLLEPDNTVPHAFQRCLQEPQRLQNRFIATFFAKTLKYLQCRGIPILPTNQSNRTNQTPPLPPTIYFGLIHPSSTIRTWCHQQFESIHSNQSIDSNQSNLVRPVLEAIGESLSFCNHTPDASTFDANERHVATTKEAIKVFLKSSSDTKNPRTIQYVECHLYDGLKLICGKLAADSLEQILKSRVLHNLWNVLLHKFDVEINATGDVLKKSVAILIDSCLVLRSLLQCSSHCLLWDQCTITADQFTLKCCDALKVSLQTEGRTALWAKAHKAIIDCIEVIGKHTTKVQWTRKILLFLLNECWNDDRCNITTDTGYRILHCAYIIVQHHLDCGDPNDSRRELMCSLTDIWGTVCIHFSISGNLNEEEQEEGHHAGILNNLKLYHPPLTVAKVINLQSNRTTPVVTTVFKVDSDNIVAMAQSVLYDAAYQQCHGLRVYQFSEFQSLWSQLLRTSVDPWDYPGSVHKLIFELYCNFAVWDHFEKYPFRDTSNASLCLVDEAMGGLSYSNLRDYHKAIHQWKVHIGQYFDILLSDTDLSQGIFRQQGSAKFLVTSYILCGNETMRSKMDEMVQMVLNRLLREEGEVIIDQNMIHCDLPRLIRAVMMTPQSFYFANTNPKKEEDPVSLDIYAFITEVLLAVMYSIERLQEVIPKLLGVPKMEFVDELRTQYFFAVKDHIISIIARIFSVIENLGGIRFQFKMNKKKSKTKSKGKMQTMIDLLFDISPDRMQWIFEFILCSTEGIFGSPVTCFLGGNQYLAQHSRRVTDIATILGFLGHHWTQFVSSTVDGAMGPNGNPVCSLFDWFPILEYPAIGIQWISCMEAITGKEEGEREFKQFMKEDAKRDAMNRMLEQHLDVNKLSARRPQKGTTQNAKYSKQHRQRLFSLLRPFTKEMMTPENLNHDLTVFAFNGRGSGTKKKERKETTKRKEKKKEKQFQITDYYQTPSSEATESQSKSVTPGGDDSMNGHGDNHEDDSDDDSIIIMESETKTASNTHDVADDALSEASCSDYDLDATPMDPVPTATKTKRIEIAPCRILDKQLMASTQKLMYFVDYTDAAKASDWKYREQIEEEFPDLGKRLLDEYNEANRDKEIETMYVVKEIIGKRYQDVPEKTWEGAHCVDHCQDSIRMFEEREKAKKKRKRDDGSSALSGVKQPRSKRRRVFNDDSSDSDLGGFLVGQSVDPEDEDYDPSTDHARAKKPRKKSRKERSRESTLSSLGIFANEEDDESSSEDAPIHSKRKQSKLKRPIRPNPYSNGHSHSIQKKRSRNVADERVQPNRKRAKISPHQSSSSRSSKASKASYDLSEHLKDFLSVDNNRKVRPNAISHRNRAGTTAPDGTLIPTSKLPSNYKRTVSRGGGSTKLSKMRKNHKNSMLAANIAAKESKFSVRKNDRSKTGHFKKRNGGAIIMGINGRSKRPSLNMGSIGKIPKMQHPATSNSNTPNSIKTPIIKNVPTPTLSSDRNNKPLKHRHKMPVRRMDNTLFKQQHKRNTNGGPPHRNMNGHSNSHRGGRGNYHGNRGNRGPGIFERRDCQMEFVGTIVKWTPSSVESALGDVEADLVPMCDSYDSAMEYKKLFAPFLFEEVRASIAQRLQEKQGNRLILRQRQDPSKNQRMKHKQIDRRNAGATLYDMARVTESGYHSAVNITTLTLQPLDPLMRLNQTYRGNDLVLLVHESHLKQFKNSDTIRIRDVLKHAIFGAPAQSRDHDPLRIHIDARNTSIRDQGNLVAIIYLDSLISAFREFRCLSTLPDNDWAPKIIKPQNILPVDGMTLTDIRDRQLPQWLRSKLNEGQQNAIAAALVKELNVTLIKGPPGTGKTTTIVSLINAALLGLGYLEKTQRPKILVCAPSNAAIDVVLERSLKRMKVKSGENKLNVKMVRIGSGSSNATAKKIHIDALLDPRHEMNRLERELREVEEDKKKVTIQWKDAVRTCKSGGGNEQQRNQEKHLREKLKSIQLRKDSIRKKIDNERNFNSNSNQSRNQRGDKTEMIRDCDVVFGTLSAAASSFLNRVQFDLLIIDEATQSKEISTLIPFQLDIRSIVLVGDEKQLPATVISKSCADFGFAKSFFERCLDNKVDAYMLNVQYRMHPEIRHWPNVTFYQNKLKDGPNIAKHVIPRMHAQQRDARLSPYAFFDLFRSRGQEEQTANKSFRNGAELDFILRLLDYMSKKFYRNTRHFKNVGIVTPYSGQVALFREHLSKHGNRLLRSVVVDTVESFQGNEKDIIIFSCVRSQKEPDRATKERSHQNLGFITDTRRLNVALTRAKLCCFIVGNSGTLRIDKTWKSLMHDAHLRGRMFSVTANHKAWLMQRSDQIFSSLQEENRRNGIVQTPGAPNDASQRNGPLQEIASSSNTMAVPMDLDNDSSSSSDRDRTMHSKSTSHRSSASSSKSSSRSRSGSRSRDDEYHHHKRSHHKHSKDRKGRSHRDHRGDGARDNRMDVDRHNGRNQGHRRSREYKTPDAEIAKRLNLPPPPTDPRLRRQK